jgi:hypothetical protein
MPKSIYQMNEEELVTFIAQQEWTVAKIIHERPGSVEHRYEAGILRDAKQLLAEKQKPV